MTRDELVEKVAQEALMSGPNKTSYSREEALTKTFNQARAAIRIALEEAAKVVEERSYMLNLGEPGEGPFTRMDRVCKETREQAAAAIRALAEPDEPRDH